MEEEAPLRPVRFIRTRCRYRQAKDAHTLICTHRHALLDVCVCARTHTNKTAHMHACTHLSVCIQGHIHVDKLFILLRVSHQRFLCKVRYVHRCGVQSLYLEKASSWLPLVPTTSRSGLAQGSGLINLRQVRW